jgi:hypothetical protein
MSLLPSVIKSPRHVHPRVRTADDYRARQREHIQEGRRQYAALAWRDPWLCLDRPPVFISAGKWLIECACGNCPSVAPEWGGLACCFECGAVYEGLEMPSDAAAIEAVLVQRPSLNARHWEPGTTVEDLLAQDRPPITLTDLERPTPDAAPAAEEVV